MESDIGTVTLHDIIERSARDGLDLQRDDGSFPPGRNYTYDEPETPVRLTSHWLEILTKATEITESSKYSEAANDAIDYLLGEDARPHGFTYHYRLTDSKDKCNGVVGQVPPIRALVYADSILDRTDAREAAEEVFLLHPFSQKLGLWERVEIDGQKISFDRTLNHQLLFAAAAAELSPGLPQATKRITHFLDKLNVNMRTYSNGLIKHYVRPPFADVLTDVSRTPRRYNMLINEVAFHYYSLSSDRKRKERGYQSVNLGALSKLKQQFPEHDIWDNSKIANALEYLRTNEKELVEGVNVKHGSPLQGIGIAKIRHRFEEAPMEDFRYLIEADLAIRDGGNNIFDLDGIDERTQSALTSTFTDFPNMVFSE